LYVIVKLLAFLLSRWKLFLVVEIAMSVIVTWENGWLVQEFARLLIELVLKDHYDEIRSLPAHLPDMIQEVFLFVFRQFLTGTKEAHEDSTFDHHSNRTFEKAKVFE
jgi:hypothetical protein